MGHIVRGSNTWSSQSKIERNNKILSGSSISRCRAHKRRLVLCYIMCRIENSVLNFWRRRENILAYRAFRPALCAAAHQWLLFEWVISNVHSVIFFFQASNPLCMGLLMSSFLFVNVVRLLLFSATQIHWPIFNTVTLFHHEWHFLVGTEEMLLPQISLLPHNQWSWVFSWLIVARMEWW